MTICLSIWKSLHPCGHFPPPPPPILPGPRRQEKPGPGGLINTEVRNKLKKYTSRRPFSSAKSNEANICMSEGICIDYYQFAKGTIRVVYKGCSISKNRFQIIVGSNRTMIRKMPFRILLSCSNKIWCCQNWTDEELLIVQKFVICIQFNILMIT